MHIIHIEEVFFSCQRCLVSPQKKVMIALVVEIIITRKLVVCGIFGLKSYAEYVRRSL